jgi:serine/threonine-protein kinase RsbW
VDMFETTFGATDINTRSALEDILSKLRPISADPVDLETLEIILAEVFNNIVEHAYDNTHNKLVHAQFTLDRNTLSVQVRDHGKPMPQETLPEGSLADLNVEFADLPEGGFGWFMIKELSQNLEYNRVGQEIHLSFEIALQRSSSA